MTGSRSELLVHVDLALNVLLELAEDDVASLLVRCIRIALLFRKYYILLGLPW